MARAEINLKAGLKADRKLDMIFVNVGESAKPEFELMGRGVEDASVEYNHETNQVTDILGITDTEVGPAKPELDLDPCTIRGGQGTFTLNGSQWVSITSGSSRYSELGAV